MIEDYENAKEELKRANHLIFNSMKLSRTVDVMRNAILRMVGACEYLIKDLLIHKKKTVPKTIKECVVLLREIYKKDEKMHEFLDFYELLKRLEKSEYTAKEEYRKNIAMVTKFMAVDAQTLEKFFEKSIEFTQYVDELTGKVHKGG